jgi:predicted MFS family arabinose efflux permease
MRDGVVNVANAATLNVIPKVSGSNVSAFNLGIFCCSFIGGSVVEGSSLTSTPCAVIAIATVALGITLLIGKSPTLRAAEGVAACAD